MQMRKCIFPKEILMRKKINQNKESDSQSPINFNGLSNHKIKTYMMTIIQYNPFHPVSFLIIIKMKNEKRR